MIITTTVHINVAAGIQKYHKDFNVKLLKYKGISEWDTEVSVEGTEEDLRALNEKAKHYKPERSKGI